MRKAEIVIVPCIGISHLVPTLEFAKRLIAIDNRFSVTVLIMPDHLNETTPTIDPPPSGIQLINLPPVDLPDAPPGFDFVESFKPHVKTTLTNLTNSATPVAALIVDMFTTAMIDIAVELSIPSYVYYTSGAGMLGLTLQFPTLDEEISTDFQDYPGGLSITTFHNPLPPLTLPSFMLRKTDPGYQWLLKHARAFRLTNGIIVNSMAELETKAFDSLRLTGYSKIYPVGPLLDLVRKSENPGEQYDKIMKWLEEQPSSSVVFLCFGSKGAFSSSQVANIATGLEKSGCRFLWSLRQPSSGLALPTDYTNLDEVLPEGFLDRTKERGLICGWAPQVEVLSHQAIGGFVSHCGWNSTLESLWFGVPILTWPLYAEQKMNAFQLTKEMDLAVPLRTDDDYDDRVIKVEEIENGVRRLMEPDDLVRRRVKEMSKMCRSAIQEGGSSLNSLQSLIQDLRGQVQCYR